MLKNYIKIAVRNIVRHRLYAFINTAGLSVGLAAFIFISLYIYNETGYDTFWEDHDHIYRVNAAWTWGEGESRYATAPPPLAGRMVDEIPEIASATRIFKRSDFTLRPETNTSRVFRETNVYIADQNYFKVFSNRLIHGDPENALTEPVSIVLSESAARRYFGAEIEDMGELPGKHVLGGKDGGTAWKITGIMKDIPANSHQNFDIIVSMSTFGPAFSNNNNWAWNIMHTYVRLNGNQPTNQALAAVPEKLNRIIQEHAAPFMGNAVDGAEAGIAYYLQPVSDIHLHSRYLREMKPNSDITYIYIFGGVAVLILLIACVNFTNLTTALSVRRAREVGVRKVLGSSTSRLVFQFLTESLIFSFAATALALGIVELGMVIFSVGFEWHFVNGLFDDPAFGLVILAITLATGILAGLYPAFVLTGFKPVTVLKGKAVSYSRKSGLRNVLVIFQFTASIGLIICTGVISDQLKFMSNKHLGFDRENVVIIENDREIEEERARFREALTVYPEVLSACFSTGIPALDQFMVRDYTVEGSLGGVGLRWFEVDEHFVETLGLKLVAGNSFHSGSSSDSLGIILNQAAVKELGLVHPVGERIVINKGENDERTVQVVGVVEDYHFESLYNRVRPLGMEFLRGYAFKDYISIRMAPGRTREALDIIKRTWATFEPQVPMSYRFLDQDFDALHRSEQRLGQLFGVFSALAVIIAGLGLFGLAAYTAQQRNREISIRKVLGAGVLQIVLMLLKNFVLLAVAGFLIASVIVFFGMEEWLSSFAFRTTLRVEQFLMALVVTAGIVLLSVSYQTIKSAFENPVNSLKEE